MSIMSFVADRIEEAINKYKEQHGISDDTLSMLRTAHAPVPDKAWIGNGARAYQGASAKLFQDVQELMATIQLYSLGISTAHGILQRADRNAQRMAGELADVFDKVF
jgi:uncharacterized protein YukE